MIRLITLLLGALAAVMISLLWVMAAYTPPRGVSYPTKLEKTCAFRGAFIPCFIVDEATSPQWNA